MQFFEDPGVTQRTQKDRIPDKPPEPAPVPDDVEEMQREHPDGYRSAK